QRRSGARPADHRARAPEGRRQQRPGAVFRHRPLWRLCAAAAAAARRHAAAVVRPGGAAVRRHRLPDPAPPPAPSRGAAAVGGGRQPPRPAAGRGDGAVNAWLFWIAAAAMTAGVVALLLRRLLTLDTGPVSPHGFDSAVYRDQLKELERERA